ncbi:MAG TPA: crotonase/enoyl-CoA hydratase family protein [Burkholderiaceae bacterium]|nr:crotonase/enoyl-CoA hydratase family protein [Burkholderiaceae bacterium]
MNEAKPGFETIDYAIADNILTITLNRPDKLNAFTGEMALELIEAFDRADADDEVRAIIVTGAGRAFCAGADLSAGGKTFDYEARDDRPDKQGSATRPDGSIDWSHPSVRDGGGRVTLRIYECLKPVIAAVNGPAVGIGATMLLPMDIRLAADNARIGFVFARRGITPEACSSWFLPRLVGVSKALEWTYTGRVMPAREARDGGLVSGLYAPDELLPAARALAREIVDNSAPVSVALTRQMIWRLAGTDHPMEAHKIDSRSIYARGRAADVREGVTAFLEKRPARFSNRVSTDMPEFFPWWKERRYE